MLTVIVFLLVFIIVLPAIIVIPQAFTSLNYFTYPIPEFVTKWIDKFWENSEWVVGLTNIFTGLILTHTLLALPMVFVTMSSGLGGVNPNLELAAMSMGCSPAKAFIQVVLPVVKPSLISSVLFSFVTSLDEVAASLFISGADTKTLPLVMWERLNTYMDPTIAVAAMYLIILTLGTYIVKEIIAYRSRRIG